VLVGPQFVRVFPVCIDEGLNGGQIKDMRFPGITQVENELLIHTEFF
jgi:hypothetical protein